MRWVIAPLIGALLLSVAGFVAELERTTELTLQLAEASVEAPRSTREAAEEVSSLPAAARLTSQQAGAFRALADALQVSAQRVFALNDALQRQERSVGTLKTRLRALDRPIGCIERELDELLNAARTVPRGLGGIASSVASLIRSQDKALRHLRSINRKLAALGVAATATGVEAPPPPDIEAPRGSGPVRSRTGC